MANYISMFQYEKDVFSVIHTNEQQPEIGDSANVFHKTTLHAKNRANNELRIIEVLETKPHKVDPLRKISIVRCEPQMTEV